VRQHSGWWLFDRLFRPLELLKETIAPFSPRTLQRNRNEFGETTVNKT